MSKTKGFVSYPEPTFYEDVPEPEHPTVSAFTSTAYIGGCNGCRNRDATQVRELRFRSVQLRLCAPCCDALAFQLVPKKGKR